MKKVLLVVMALCCAMVAGAQKGEKYLGVGLNLSAGSSKSESKSGNYTQTETYPADFKFGLGAEFGYFVSDNVRLALYLNFNHEDSPVSKSSDNSWLKEKANLFGINPNIAYYKKIADRFYYTPEVGASFQFGKYSEPVASNTTVSYDATGWNIYANIVSFEYRLSDRFALGVTYGAIGYNKLTIKGNSDSSTSYGNFYFDLGSAGLNAKFYF